MPRADCLRASADGLAGLDQFPHIRIGLDALGCLADLALGGREPAHLPGKVIEGLDLLGAEGDLPRVLLQRPLAPEVLVDVLEVLLPLGDAVEAVAEAHVAAAQGLEDGFQFPDDAGLRGIGGDDHAVLEELDDVGHVIGDEGFLGLPGGGGDGPGRLGLGLLEFLGDLVHRLDEFEPLLACGVLEADGLADAGARRRGGLGRALGGGGRRRAFGARHHGGRQRREQDACRHGVRDPGSQPSHGPHLLVRADLLQLFAEFALACLPLGLGHLLDAAAHVEDGLEPALEFLALSNWTISPRMRSMRR